MIQRYSRAVLLTPPKVAAQMPGLVDGYWVDENSFFFLDEKLELARGRVVAVPSIADTTTNSVHELMPLEELAALLARQAGRSIDPETLSSAEFDMPDRSRLAVSTGGCDYLIDWQQRRVVQANASFELPALYSPDGRYACFVKGHDLWLKEKGTGVERPLTTGGVEHHSYGRQPESCLWAVTYRQRPIPMGLWSPDSQWFLTHRIDERFVPDLALLQHAPPGGGRPILHTYKYPLPEDSLPVAICVAIHVTSGRVVTFAEFPAPVLISSPFFLRMIGFSGPDSAWLLRTDRYFKQAELIQLDLARGTGRIALSEAVQSGYLEFHQFLVATPNVRVLAASSEVIWYSERNGWAHLYLYDASTGKLKNPITRGEWLVRDIVHVDEQRRKLLFLASGIDPQADPARRLLCSIHFDGSGFEVLCAHDGEIFVAKTEPAGAGQDRPFRPSTAQAGVSPHGRFGVVLYASVERGNVTRIVDLQTQQGFAIAAALPASDEVLPRPFTALAADGVTRLHGLMFCPSNLDDEQCYPLIDYIYPGPQVAWQPQSFRSVNAAQARALAELGFVTIMLDTRGMPFRSRALHQAGYGELLEPQLADHAAVVHQLRERHRFIDRERAGIIGYSGGGFAAARALFDYPDIFKVGVAVCGNHDNSFNIASWSDKYRGPGDRESRAHQANGAAAHRLKGKLLLISGDMDENVHVSHTLSLVDALVRANRDFDLLIVPNEGHGVLMTSGYTLRRVWDYFVRHLRGETPPSNYAIEFEPDEIARMERRAGREFR
jgi:dipeptidyl aminopeptidase/acylaminoacyl peptidase